jgi:guanylate kinase
MFLKVEKMMFPINFEHHKRIILVGKAASGKDNLRKRLESKGFKYAVSYTTRPPREGEEDGVDYLFIKDETAQQMIDAGNFYEYVEFNGWIYGTTKLQFWSDDLFIMTPKGISHIKPEDRKKSFIIYLDVDVNTRKERLLQRDMPGDSLERRIEADEIDFKEFVDYDLRITNSDF